MKLEKEEIDRLAVVNALMLFIYNYDFETDIAPLLKKSTDLNYVWHHYIEPAAKKEGANDLVFLDVVWSKCGSEARSVILEAALAKYHASSVKGIEEAEMLRRISDHFDAK